MPGLAHRTRMPLPITSRLFCHIALFTRSISNDIMEGIDTYACNQASGRSFILNKLVARASVQLYETAEDHM